MQNIPTGRFVWFEYGPKPLTGFFGELFNWSTVEVPMPQGAYTMISSGDATIGGYTQAPGWTAHLQVDDAAAAVKKVTALGGSVAMPATRLGEVGVMALVADPLGGKLALWQPLGREPVTDYRGTNGSFFWTELYTADPAASAKFYGELVGFTADVKDMGRGPYTILSKDGKPRAGIIQAPRPNIPQQWMPYVQVASTDTTVEKAKKLGATVVMPAADLPIGRIAAFTDPAGVAIGVAQPA